ncbi:RHS repeat-associated core domain-containing protein [Frankineae bacterium MT45]|nr:RHS repeat-associated core domain-containing protein [Frankineae bacterium MT45]
MPGKTLTWDANGRLSSVTNVATGQVQTRIYDAGGNLLVQSDPVKGTTAFLGDVELQLSPTGTLTAQRTYTLGGATLASRTATSGVAGSTLTWLTTDPQGTATISENPTTGAVTTRKMDPFGNPRGSAVTWPTDRGFLNAPLDPFTTFTHLGARDYSPTLGRFLSVDPVLSPSDPQQNNGYSYALNSPVSNADPAGTALPCVNLGECDPHQTSTGSFINITPTHPHEGNLAGSGGNPGIGPTAGAQVTAAMSSHSGGSKSKSSPHPVPDVTPKPGTPVDKNDCENYLCASKQMITDVVNGVVSVAKSLNPIPAIQGCLTNPSWHDCIQAAIAVGTIVCALFTDGVCELARVGEGAEEATVAIDSVEDAAAVVPHPEADPLPEPEGACANSFNADTLVVMAGGIGKPISQVRVGDWVRTANPETGKTAIQMVTKIWVNHDSDLMDVTVTAGGKTSTLHATQHHLFWDGTRRAWVEADQLGRGDHLRADDATITTVTSTAAISGASDMWDLTVANDHDFYVGSSVTNALVHNCPVDPRDVHGADRVASRGIDVQYVTENGDLFIQNDGQLVRVLDNGNGTSDVVIRDASNSSGQPTSVIQVPNSYVDGKIHSGAWG